MNTKAALQSFEQVQETYLRALDRFDLEELTRVTAEDDWSIGQMYMHLIQSALYMQLRNAELCGNPQEAAAGGEGKTENGQAVFAAGSFPPIRIRVPADKQAAPPQPESKRQIVEGLHRVAERMRELEPTLDAIPPAQTVRHPALGALNAKEWFCLVDMHFRHHLRQLERLEAQLAASRA
ncbi:DinB family protein [Paenibacillus ginsengihumi]|jgi:hypothetical protein|uniref:DinB family protein n=1 Tax=Paenibacillus ginsengihumi TaxID=431596 RepID=UPI000369A71E|nr:DinB family protein [Paenibacillus ginsengihumi]